MLNDGMKGISIWWFFLKISSLIELFKKLHILQYGPFQQFC
jgi:hypothetical protein